MSRRRAGASGGAALAAQYGRPRSQTPQQAHPSVAGGHAGSLLRAAGGTELGRHFWRAHGCSSRCCYAVVTTGAPGWPAPRRRWKVAGARSARCERRAGKGGLACSCDAAVSVKIPRRLQPVGQPLAKPGLLPCCLMQPHAGTKWPPFTRGGLTAPSTRPVHKETCPSTSPHLSPTIVLAELACSPSAQSGHVGLRACRRPAADALQPTAARLYHGATPEVPPAAWPSLHSLCPPEA